MWGDCIQIWVLDSGFEYGFIGWVEYNYMKKKLKIS